MVMISDQRAYWDKAASEKKFTTPFQMDVFKTAVTEDARILDVGCGYGRVMNQLYQEGFKKICGIDFSVKMIERGKNLYPHLDFKEYNTQFPVKNSSCDAVILIAVLTCIIENDDQEQLMDEIQRVLKPGGILYINDFLLNRDQRNSVRYTAFEKIYKTYGVFEIDKSALLRHHTEEHLFHLTRNYEIKTYETLIYTTMNNHTSNGFYYMGKLRKQRCLSLPQRRGTISSQYPSGSCIK